VVAQRAATPCTPGHRTSAVVSGSAVRSCPEAMAAVASATKSPSAVPVPGGGSAGQSAGGSRKSTWDEGRFGQREVQVRPAPHPESFNRAEAVGHSIGLASAKLCPTGWIAIVAGVFTLLGQIPAVAPLFMVANVAYIGLYVGIGRRLWRAARQPL
jgi:hypothetical protein